MRHANRHAKSPGARTERFERDLRGVVLWYPAIAHELNLLDAENGEANSE